MLMIKIKVFPDKHYIGGTPNHMMHNYRKVCELEADCSYKGKFQLVDDESYTHAILLNKAKPQLKNIPKENVIGFAFEPNQFLKWNQEDFDYLEKYAFKYLASAVPDQAPTLFKSHYSYMWHCQKRSERFLPREKKQIMSMMTSNKTFLPGHLYRLELAKRIIKETDMDIHIYGSGCELLQAKDDRIMGRYGDNEYPIFEDYMFNIAICNYPSESLVDQKFLDPITFDCVPIFYGASKIEEFFGKECCVKLTGDSDADIEIIKNVYENPHEFYYDLSHAKFQLYEGDCYFPEFIVKEFIN